MRLQSSRSIRRVLEEEDTDGDGFTMVNVSQRGSGATDGFYINHFSPRKGIFSCEYNLRLQWSE
jgi:hypothetical protein